MYHRFESKATKKRWRIVDLFLQPSCSVHIHVWAGRERRDERRTKRQPLMYVHCDVHLKPSSGEVSAKQLMDDESPFLLRLPAEKKRNTETELRTSRCFKNFEFQLFKISYKVSVCLEGINYYDDSNNDSISGILYMCLNYWTVVELLFLRMLSLILTFSREARSGNSSKLRKSHSRYRLRSSQVDAGGSLRRCRG